MLRVDASGWLFTEGLGDPEWRMVPSERHDALAVPAPLAPVFHTTDSPNPAARAAESWRRRPEGSQPKASAHFIVGRDGVVYQLVPCLRASWHARRPRTLGGRDVVLDAYRALIAGRLVPSINAYTVGIEVENIGHVRRHRVDDHLLFTRWPHYLDPSRRTSGPDSTLKVDPARLRDHAGEWYDDFPARQVAACAHLLRALASAYGWEREHCGLGHVDFDPDRKSDPWPLFREVYLPEILASAFVENVA